MRVYFLPGKWYNLAAIKMETQLEEKLKNILEHFEELEQNLAEAGMDYQLVAELSKERAELEPVVNLAKQYQTAQSQLEETKFLLGSTEGEMRELAELELQELSEQMDSVQAELRALLVPKDPRDNRNVIVEIRAGTGGDEAALFASDLLRMYLRYADLHHYKTEILSANEIGIGGYKEVTFAVKGKGAYSRLKFESGVHRVQRVPQTESQGRIHTSAATVAVMPELEDVDLTLDERDLVITAEFSSGPGGQHMQKNQTAARVVHKPSGIMVKIQSERSLSQNKRLAFAIIQARLEEQEHVRQSASTAAERKAQVGSGDRSEKIRTYNYPQSRVTDHRVGFTSYNLAVVMDGDLDPFIDALTLADETEKLSAATE